MESLIEWVRGASNQSIPNDLNLAYRNELSGISTTSVPLYEMAERHGTWKTWLFDQRLEKRVVLAPSIEFCLSNEPLVPPLVKDIPINRRILAAVSRDAGRAQSQTTRHIARGRGSWCCDRPGDAPVRGLKCC